MGARFKSADRRNFLIVLSLTVATDFVAVAAITSFFVDTWGKAFLIGAVVLLALYGVQVCAGAFSAARYSIIHILFNRKQRIDAFVRVMQELRLPQPSTFYLDPEEYLTEVVQSEEASKEARLFAGVTIGRLTALRETSRPVLLMTMASDLEAAISRYAESCSLTNAFSEEFWDRAFDASGADPNADKA